MAAEQIGLQACIFIYLLLFRVLWPTAASSFMVTHSWQSAEVSPQCPHVHSVLKIHTRKIITLDNTAMEMLFGDFPKSVIPYL